MFLLTCWILVALNHEVLGACDNLLSESNPLSIKDSKGDVIDVLTRCRHLVDKYPELCQEEPGENNGVCCNLCLTNNLNCINNNAIKWKIDGKRVSCKEYIQDDISKCQHDSFLALSCCKSCRDAFRCKDIVSDFFHITLTLPDGSRVNVTRCRDVVTKYLSMCRGEVGKMGGACCDSCSKYDLSCIDDSLSYWVVNDKRYDCAGYVAADPCRCKEVEDKCCASCKGKVCEPCRDFLSKQFPIEVSGPYGDVTLKDCGRLVSDYLSVCEDVGKPGGHCCKSCKGKDLSCVDNSLFVFNVAGKKQGCAEYIAGDPCRCEENLAAGNCCASCEGKVCNKCTDDLGGKNYIDVLDKNDKLVKRLRDCATLTKDYLYLCKWHHGKEGGMCCASCSKQDLTCIDDGTFGWPKGDKIMRCKEYVAAYPHKCQDKVVQEFCCASCKGCKGDDADFRVTITLKLRTKAGMKKVRCRNCSCADIGAKGKAFTKKACRNKKKKIKQNCCKLCGGKNVG